MKNKINIAIEKHSSSEVLNALLSEREYQDYVWNKSTTETGGVHSSSEFLLFSIHYLNEAIKAISTNGEPKATSIVLENFRKIGAMMLHSLNTNCIEEKNEIFDVFYLKRDFNLTEFIFSINTVLTRYNFLEDDANYVCEEVLFLIIKAMNVYEGKNMIPFRTFNK